MEDLRRDCIELLRLSITLLCACAVLYITKIGCPIRFITGISCPGCGISRAIISALHGDLAKAMYFHPLFWFPFVLVVLWLKRRCFSPIQIDIFLITAILLYLLVYLIRLLNGSEVVVCHPEDGLIYKIIVP